MYLLDTNACISYLNQVDSPVRRRMQALRPEAIALCSVVEAELHYGVERSAKPEENRKRLQPFLEQFLSYAFGRRSAQIFGEIRASLHHCGPFAYRCGGSCRSPCPVET